MEYSYSLPAGFLNKKGVKRFKSIIIQVICLMSWIHAVEQDDIKPRIYRYMQYDIV